MKSVKTANFAGSLFSYAAQIYNLLKDKSEDEIANIFTKNKIPVSTTGSIIRLLKPFIVEPVIFVNKDLRTEEVLSKVLNLDVEMFASIYAQAFKVITDLYGLDSKYAIEILSSEFNLIADNTGLEDDTEENFAYALESLDVLPIKTTSKEILSLEAKKKVTIDKSHAGKKVEDKSIPSSLVKEILLTTTVTKVTKKGDKTSKDTYVVEFPITIKASVVYTDSNSIMNAVSAKTNENSFSERLDAYRSGGISFKDLILANDLIQDYKKAKIKDKDNLLNYIHDREIEASKKVLSHGRVGFNLYYGIMVITEQDRARIESKLRGKLSKFKTKEEFLTTVKCMLLNVVDREWERVTIYTKDLKGYADVDFNSLNRSGNKESTELLKAILGQRQPVL